MEVAQSQDDIIRAAETGQKITIGNNVKHIRLRSINFSGSSPDVFVNFFQMLKNAPRIESLDVIDLDDDFVNGWLGHVMEVLISCPTLTDLSLTGSQRKWGKEFELFCNAIKTNKINVKKLELGMLELSELKTFLDSLPFNTTLESLSIRVEAAFTDENGQIYGHSIKFGDKLMVSKNLKRFTTETDNADYIRFICEGLQQNSTLEELTFRMSDFGDNGLNLIAKILSSDQSRLKSLQLIYSALGNLNEFCEAIKKNTTLERLGMPASFIGRTIGMMGGQSNVSAMLAAISENNSIQEFNWNLNGRTMTQQMIDLIQKRKFSHLTLDLTKGDLATIKVPMIIEALKYDRLVSLEISAVMLTQDPESASALSSFIAETKTLKKLVTYNLPNTTILQGLIKNTSITDFEVLGMTFSDADSDVELLCELISANKTITKLRVGDIDKKEEIYLAGIFKALKFNQTLTDLTFESIWYSDTNYMALFDNISNALKVNDTLLYLILENLSQRRRGKIPAEQVPLFLEKYRELFSINKSIRRLEFAQFEHICPYVHNVQHPSMPEVRRLWNQNLSHQSEIKINTIILAKNIVRQISESVFPREIWLQIFRHLGYKSVPELDPIISEIFSLHN